LRVGLVGFGYAGRTFHAPLLCSTPGLQLIAVSSRQPEAVHAALGTAVEVLADPLALVRHPALDLVVVASPNDTHHPLTLAALQAGKAVVVDKPFALDAAQAEALVREAEARGQLLSVFHNRRWDGDFLGVAALLQAGELGRIAHAELHFDRFRPQVRTRWREAAGPGGGLWIDLGPHLIDQALQLFGPPQAISADIATLRDGGQADDCFSARLRYASGLRVTLGASMIAAQPGPRFLLQGLHGSAIKWGLDTQEGALKAGRRPDPTQPQAWGHDPQPLQLQRARDAVAPEALSPDTRPVPHGCYGAYYAAVRDALRGQAPNPVPAREALAVMQWLDLGRRSAQERRELQAGA
jgi:predicted dehydrogenase